MLIFPLARSGSVATTPVGYMYHRYRANGHLATLGPLIVNVVSFCS
jgi:hypothetical protein